MVFSESWLAEHEAKMAGIKGVRPLPNTIRFAIPLLLLLPNRTNGRSWHQYHRQKTRLRKLMDAEVGRWSGHAPMNLARVTISRFGSGIEPDPDNLMASCKPLIDLLLVKSRAHPHSFGLIVDDAPQFLLPVAFFVQVDHKSEERTEVLIERL